MIRYSFIIVTFNSEKHIEACLQSVFDQSIQNYEITIVDNASKDQTRAILDSFSSKIRVIENAQNLGFAVANNQGIAIASGEFIILLNPDAILDRHFLENVQTAIENSTQNIGMFAPKMLQKDKETIYSLGLELSIMRRLFDRGRGCVDHGQFDDERNVFGPCGACAIYRKSMLDDIQIHGEYFDSSFFLLVEDFDIAWRARNRGWNAQYAPEARCFHDGGISKKKTDYVQYLTFRNRYFLLAKNENLISFMLRIPFYLLYDIPRFFFFICKNNYASRGIRELLDYLPLMLSKRRIASQSWQ